MNVMVVGPVGTVCGIAEFGAMLGEALRACPGIEVSDSRDWPEQGLNALAAIESLEGDVVHLNYHAALHSRWHPIHIRRLQQRGIAVVVTYHDTYATGNSDQAKGLAEAADGFVVHEPVGKSVV